MQYPIRSIICLTMIGLGLVAPARAGKGRIQESYGVSAQYSGVVNKSFPDLGETEVEMDFSPAGRVAGRENLRVSVRGSMQNPQDHSRLELNMQGKYMLDRHIYMTSGTTQMPDAFKSCQRSLQNLMPFLYLARREVPSGGNDPGREYLVSGSSADGERSQDALVLNYKKMGAGSWKATLEQGGQIQASLVLSTGNPGVARIDRIEVPVPDKHIRLILTRQGSPVLVGAD